MNDVQAEQVRRNQESQDAWQRYAGHRERVTALLVDSLSEQQVTREAGAARRLCVLGAGNCNDIDLSQLAAAFDEIHLADLDDSAMAAAVNRAGLSQSNRIVLHPGCDLSGLLARLSQCQSDGRVVSMSDVAELARVAAEFSIGSAASRLLETPFDTVASVGLLSQLVESVLNAIPDPATALPIVTALRARHLRLLLELVRPGGCGVLVTEIVSTDSAPQLVATEESELPGLLRQLIGQGNFFTGLNPAALLAAFHQEPGVNALLETVRIEPPWKWDFVFRTYAVTAFVAQRRSANHF